MDSRTHSPIASLCSPPTFTPQAETAPTVNQLANDIVELLPDHETYVEPCASRGTLLGVKPASRNEIVNGVHGDLLHLYETIKDEHSELVRFLAESPLDSSLRNEWEKTFLRGYRPTDDIVRAAQFFVQFASPSSVTGDIDDSQGAIGEHLQQFKHRFDDVLIESKTPHELMEAYEDDSVCMFINPPYDGSRYEYANRLLDLLIMEHLMEWQPAEIHCSGCGKELGTVESPNSDVYETGEATHEKRINTSVRTPMVSVAVLLNVRCTDCSGEAE